MTVKPDEKGQGASRRTAKAAGLARNEHYLKLTEDAHVVGEGARSDATELTVQLTPDDKLIQSMALRGNSRITGTPGAAAGRAGHVRTRHRPDLRAGRTHDPAIAPRRERGRARWEAAR
jgi:hypothetical protein